MIKLKLKGPWRQTVALLRTYDKRVQYVEKRIAYDLAIALLERLKETVPSGDEFKKYVDSLEAVEVTDTRGVPLFAVVSKRSKMRLGEVAGGNLAAKTVVYIYPTSDSETSTVVQLLTQANPWPVDMVPHGLSNEKVTLIHRVVTEGEVKWAREQATEVAIKYRAEFRREGIRWGKAVEAEKHADGLESLPDYMSLALRAEFGINAAPQPHWRPAVNWLMKSIPEILANDEKIHKALHDELFRDHTLEQGSGLPTMKAQEFLREVKEFQQKVVNS